MPSEIPDCGRQVDDILRSLGWPPELFFIGGSGGLALRGIRPIGDDLDLGVTTERWWRLYETGRWSVYRPSAKDPRRRCDPPYLVQEINGVEVHVFFAWRRRGAEESPYNDYNRVFYDGIEFVHGWPCLRLPLLLAMKADAISHPQVRPKDVADIAAISAYLTERASG